MKSRKYYAPPLFCVIISDMDVTMQNPSIIGDGEKQPGKNWEVDYAKDNSQIWGIDFSDDDEIEDY